MPSPPDQPNMPDVVDLPTSEYEPETGFSSTVLMFGVVIVVIGMIIVFRSRKTLQ